MTTEGVAVRHIDKDSLVVIREEDSDKLSDGAKVGADAVRQLLGSDPIVIKGPLGGAHAFIDPTSPTFEKAYRAMQKGDNIRGGDNAGGSILADAYGYSGFVTPLTKGLLVTIASALFITGKVATLDIQCDSIGDVPIIHQSMANFSARSEGRCDVRYVVALKSLNDVHVDYRTRCLTSFRAGSHRLYVSKKVVPSGKKIEEVLEKSEEELHTLAEKRKEGESFTYFGPAFGTSPFREGRHLFKFGVPSHFRAFISTIPDLALYGATVSKDGRTVAPNVTPLVAIKSADEWYSTVIKANIWKNSYFLRATKQYSAISNLLTPPSKGVKFTLRGDKYEAGETGESDVFNDPAASESDSEEDDYYGDDSQDFPSEDGENASPLEEENVPNPIVPAVSETAFKHDPLIPAVSTPVPLTAEEQHKIIRAALVKHAGEVPVPSSTASTSTTVSAPTTPPISSSSGSSEPPSRSVPRKGKGKKKLDVPEDETSHVSDGMF